MPKKNDSTALSLVAPTQLEEQSTRSQRPARQGSLFADEQCINDTTTSQQRGRHERVDSDEAVNIGRALVKHLKDEALSADQSRLLGKLKAELPANRRAPTPVEEQAETLLTLERGQDAEVRVSWRRFRGSSPFLDIRRWERGRRDAMHPTRQGVTIRLREIPSLLMAAAKAARLGGRSE